MQYNNTEKYLLWIKILIVDLLVYIPNIIMLRWLGLDLYAAVMVSIALSFFVHELLVKSLLLKQSAKAIEENYDVITPRKSELNVTKAKEVNVTLDELIGLETVKKNISNIINLIKVDKKRGIKPIVGHYIFQGNPGTGKTTVGRILGKTFKEMDFLKKGHFIEVTRDDLIGQFQGHTASKTTDILHSALGGVLFIDEAYSLVTDSQDSFGMEAINTIVPFMENHRDDFILIIAGYTDKLNDFLDTNVGFKSRFDYTINFADYTSYQLYDIFKHFAKAYNWKKDTDMALQRLFKSMVKYKDKNFGNGRDVRKIFEKIKQNQSNRLIPVLNALRKKDNMLYEIQADDVNRVY